MCEEWRNDFMAFYNDMGTRPTPKHSLDRIDNEKGYYKDNCRWVTKEVQANNTRTNVFIEYKGKRQTIAQWAKELGLPKQTLHNRIKNGLPIERVMYPGRLHKYLVI
jgi:transcriptional regulator of acetoin/glycerol metabolism